MLILSLFFGLCKLLLNRLTQMFKIYKQYRSNLLQQKCGLLKKSSLFKANGQNNFVIQFSNGSQKTLFFWKISIS